MEDKGIIRVLDNCVANVIIIIVASLAILVGVLAGLIDAARSYMGLPPWFDSM